MYTCSSVSRQATGQIRATIAANLVLGAAAKGLTQREVADAVGATPAQVSKWMNGHTEPRAYLFKLADLLFDGRVADLYREPETKAAA